MMKTRFNAILRHLTHPTALILCALLFVVFFLFIMPAGEAPIHQNNSTSLLDMKIHYPPTLAEQWIQAYGSEGRTAYIHFTWTYDLIFPFVYGLFFFSVISALIQRTNPTRTFLRKAAYFPMLTVCADYLENLCITMLLKSFPDLNPLLIRISSGFTSLKWGLLVSSSLAAGYLFIRLLINSRQSLGTINSENRS